MKTLSRYKLLFIFCSLILSSNIKGQDGAIPPIQSIRIAPQLETYTVSATNDTSYVYEVEMVLNDTLAFSSVQIQISEKQNNQWQVINNVNRNAPNASAIICQQPTCIYRRNENIWLIYLGYDSLIKQSKVSLHFNNPLLNEWNMEF